MKKNIFNKLKHRVIQRLFLETYGSIVRPYGRNFKTVDNNPINYKSHPDISIDEYSDNDGRFWVEVEVKGNSNLSIGPRSFPTASEAEMYARKVVDRIKIILANH